MYSLVFPNDKGQSVTTSLKVAEVFGKEHKNVLRDIETLSCSDEFNRLNFELISYQDSMNREQRAYQMTKDGFSFLVMGYTGDKAGQFKERFIAEFNHREELLKSDEYILARAMEIQRNRIKVLEASLEATQEQMRLQETNLRQQAPKVQYYDEVLDGQGLISTTIIAKDLGMSANALNNKLHKMGVIYRVQGAWVPYSKYQDTGYCKSKTFPYVDKDGQQKTAIHFYWTEKGRQAIINLLQNSKRA
jgi:Rha family phage regulatory protein